MSQDNPLQNLFTRPPKTTLEDKRRLSPHLRSWHELNETFQLHSFSAEDLQRLIILELKGKRRKTLVDKLVSRLKTTESKSLRGKIEQYLTED